jgi:hypothetical protein
MSESKQERMDKARGAQSLVERLKERSGVTVQRPGETEKQFKQRIGKNSPYARDAGGNREFFTGRAPEPGEHNR